MNQKDEELLLKDLCARLPYGVKCKVLDFPTSYILSGISLNAYEKLYFTQLDFKESDGYADVKFCKPYLFPLSSMTEEQKEDMIKSTVGIGSDKNVFDWYNKNKFDYRGLIPLGLAIDCTNLNIY